MSDHAQAEQLPLFPAFDSYVCEGDSVSVDVDGFTLTATIRADTDHGAPWDEECGHGPVSDWTSRAKSPSERVLASDRNSKRFYDFGEAVRIAKRDGWGVTGGRLEGETAAQYAARAAEADFQALKGWANDDWRYVGIVISATRKGVTLSDHAASLWGIEANYPNGDGNAYLRDVANELLGEALDEARARLADLCGDFCAIERVADIVRQTPAAEMSAIVRTFSDAHGQTVYMKPTLSEALAPFFGAESEPVTLDEDGDEPLSLADALAWLDDPHTGRELTFYTEDSRIIITAERPRA